MSGKNSQTAGEAAASQEQAILNTAAGIASQSAAPTQAQIDEWKKKHGGVYEVAIESGEKCYLRQPNRKDLSAATASGKKDPLKFNESILNNCWLAGDDAIRTNDQLFLAASQELDQILDFKTATVKKL